MADWKNRIVGHGEVDPREIVANPRNWRIHPMAQSKALEGVLGEIGWIAPVTINKTTGFCLDGHLRVALAMKKKAATVPVQYVELTEEEEALALPPRNFFRHCMEWKLTFSLSWKEDGASEFPIHQKSGQQPRTTSRLYRHHPTRNGCKLSVRKREI